MNKFLLCCVFISLWSCTKPSLQNHHWSEWEPYVVSVNPEAGYALAETSSLKLTFSQPLLAETLSVESIFIINQTDFANYSSDWQDMADSVIDADVASLPLTFSLDDTHQILDVVADLSSVTTSGEYVLVITPQVLSELYVPINQTHVSGTEHYFMVAYNLTRGQTSKEADVAASESATSTVAAVDSSDSPSDQSELATAESEESAEIESTTPSFSIDSVIISEIVTDPQQDFNDSAEGNGVLFDAMVGNGTLGSTDEYIEFYNGSVDAVSLTGYQVEMLDGTDVQQMVSSETWSDVYFSGDSDFETFLPGDYVVLGNPDGAINNTIAINLWDAEGILIESISIEDANADDIFNEAYSLDFETGFWEQTVATPGY